MFDGITPQLLFGQLLIGVINGSFYAMLAMGLAIIFGLMHVVNFAHGAQYMLALSWRGCCLARWACPIGGAVHRPVGGRDIRACDGAIDTKANRPP